MINETLIILAEECAEVAQAAAKCQRFSYDQIPPGRSQTNGQQLETELGDLLAMVEVLINAGYVTPENLHAASQRKLQKLRHYSNIPHRYLTQINHD